MYETDFIYDVRPVDGHIERMRERPCKWDSKWELDSYAVGSERHTDFYVLDHAHSKWQYSCDGHQSQFHHGESLFCIQQYGVRCVCSQRELQRKCHRKFPVDRSIRHPWRKHADASGQGQQQCDIGDVEFDRGDFRMQWVWHVHDDKNVRSGCRGHSV